MHEKLSKRITQSRNELERYFKKHGQEVRINIEVVYE